MAVRFDTILDLLEQKEWASCCDLAAKALPEGEWTKEQKAFLHFAQCRSLSNLERYTTALQPGQFAVFLSEEIGDYDLLGRSLLELAWVQHKIPGMESMAVETQRRFLENFPRYKTIRGRYLGAQLNLGVYLRAAGKYNEALEQFGVVYRDAQQRDNMDIAHLSCTYAVWEALRLERIEEAEALLRESERQAVTPQLQAAHYLDLAQLFLLKQNAAVACGYVLRALPLIEQVHKEDGHLLPVALDLLHKIALRFDDTEAALIAAILSKIKAEADDRQDLVAQVCASIRNIALRHPEMVEQLMVTLDGGR